MVLWSGDYVMPHQQYGNIAMLKNLFRVDSCWGLEEFLHVCIIQEVANMLVNEYQHIAWVQPLTHFHIVKQNIC
mgnify:CR=1 FL=1